nr:hypothetical protein [Paenibacillus sp. A3]
MLNQNKVAGIIGISYNDIDDSVSTDIPIISIDRLKLGAQIWAHRI